MAQPVEPLPHRDAVLQEKATDLVNDRGSLRHQAVAHTMQRLEIELLVRFWRYAPRRGTLRGFSNRMRISKVIFVSLPAWRRPVALALRRGRGRAAHGSHSAFPCPPLSRSG